MLSKLICGAAMVTSGQFVFGNDLMFEPVPEENLQKFPIVESIGLRMEHKNGWFKKAINDVIKKGEDIIDDAKDIVDDVKDFINGDGSDRSGDPQLFCGIV